MASPKQGRRTVLVLAAATTLVHALGCSDDETTGGTTTTGGGNGGDPTTGGMGGSPTTGGMGGTPSTGGMGGNGGMGGGGPICASGAEATSIAGNHPMGAHTVMTIPTADIDAAQDATYTVELGGGMGGHTHEITITAADFAELSAGNTISVTSTTGGNNDHTHVIMIACA